MELESPYIETLRAEEREEEAEVKGNLEDWEDGLSEGSDEGEIDTDDEDAVYYILHDDADSDQQGDVQSTQHITK